MRLSVLVGVLLSLGAQPVLAQTVQHPFLLVRRDQFSHLQSLSNQEPWSGMKTRAIAECTQRTMQPTPSASCNGSLNTSLYPSTNSHSTCMRAIMGSCALAYIVDPANRSTYINKIMSSMPYWENIITVQSGADDGTRNSSDEYYTNATSAYFNTILALDIIHDDLDQEDLEYAEFLMEQEFNHFYGITRPVYNFVTDQPDALAYHAPSRHPPAKEAALMLWKIYKNDFRQNDPDSRALLFGGMLNNQYPDLDGDGKNIEGYMPEIEARINSSGVYTEGSSYAHAGWGLNRDERSHLIDIFEFTGKDNEFGIDFYTNPRYQNFYEWLYGYASTPFGVMTSFGDTYAFRQLSDDGHGGNSWSTSSHIGQASKFGANPGAYAIWKSRNEPQQGRILNYLLYSNNNLTNRPTSKIYENGGGFFLSQPVNDLSLYGALWNVRQPDDGSPIFHVRKDVNAIYVAAYGAPLLMNGGFCGSSDPSGPGSCFGQDENGAGHRFPGSYLGDRAISNNVGLVNYSLGSDYLNPPDDGNTSLFGTGILEGFTNSGLDYAAGKFTGLPSGSHDRSLLLIHPSQNSRGYFVVFDEFSSVSGTAHLAFHPNASSRQVVTNLTEYNLPVGRRLFSDASTGLSLFFATPPSNIQFQRGIIATAGSVGAYVPEYFFNTYPISGSRKQVATVLFPYNSANPKGNMSRVSGSGFTGATITQGQTVDTILEANGNITHDNTSLSGKAAFYRKVSGQTTAYFVRQGRSFNSQGIGFSSDQDVTIYINGQTGKIVSPGTNLTLNTGSGSSTFFVPPGTYDLPLNTQTPGFATLISGWLGPSYDQNGDNKVNSIDFATIIP